MAGNKINTKKKEDKNKSTANRGTDQTIEETASIDFSLLRKPILTSVTGFAQARKIFDLATEELKNLLSNECDLLYECKVCRNIFRSLANFISHKRVYCKEKFNTSQHGHFFKEISTVKEVLKIRRLEEGYQESLKEKNEAISLEEDDERIPVTKDLTSIVESIAKNKGVNENELENQQLVFQKIPKSSVAVYQNVETSDTMEAQVKELDNILSQENAVLQSDGTFKVQTDDKVVANADNVIQISDDDETEESDILKCKICNLQFSTLKTLKFHIKYKHLENRLVYPCPDCLDIFSTSWSVYRHLFKVHRKTGAQIRRLRESIQAKAFRMNNPPASYEKRKTAPKTSQPQKITEEERLDKENQAWLEELDGESEGRRCGGCGRTFERRAALAAHTHTCARRHRRRIQIQIRKDYHKESNPYLALARGAASVSNDTKSVTEDQPTVEKIQENKDTKIEVEKNPLAEAEMTVLGDKKELQENEEMEIEETILESPQKFYVNTMINKLPFATQVEKGNLKAFKQKIQLDIEMHKLLCKKCDSKYNQMQELLEHMAEHYKWVRYACKLCNFKHFNFDKLPEHVKIVHKLKGDTDFYFSTVKAIDGSEALELSETKEELNEANETSPDSRRPSRCSSDSSRVSDDSSSSSTRTLETGSRKRKANLYKNKAKKKKESLITTDETDEHKGDLSPKDLLHQENNNSSNSKIFEENSSDLDDIEEKISKRHNIEIPSVASRRPVRKRTKPKNADFEYDLSNLLKMEAQGYRDSQSCGTKVTQNKKKLQQDIQNNYDILNKDCCGSMITLSRKSVELAQGHMRTPNIPVFKTTKEARVSNIFARPMVPKITKVEKISPKKVEIEEPNDISYNNKVIDSSSVSINKDTVMIKNEPEQKESKIFDKPTNEENNVINDQKCSSNKLNTVDTVVNDPDKNVIDKSVLNPDKVNDKLNLAIEKTSGSVVLEATKSNVNRVPIKLRRQSLDVIKNPLIKKNITDFSKAGLKTKILVIKPINRNADGIQNLKTPLKYQTIKLKDPNKSIVTTEEKKSDKVVVVQVPTVDGVPRPISANTIGNNTKIAPVAELIQNIIKEEIKSDITLSDETNLNSVKSVSNELSSVTDIEETSSVKIESQTGVISSESTDKENDTKESHKNSVDIIKDS